MVAMRRPSFQFGLEDKNVADDTDLTHSQAVFNPFQFNLRTIFWLTALVAVGLWLKRVLPIPELQRKPWYGIVVPLAIIAYLIRRGVVAILKIQDMEL
jgi:hypothetical protein